MKDVELINKFDNIINEYLKIQTEIKGANFNDEKLSFVRYLNNNLLINSDLSNFSSEKISDRNINSIWENKIKRYEDMIRRKRISYDDAILKIKKNIFKDEKS